MEVLAAFIIPATNFQASNICPSKKIPSLGGSEVFICKSISFTLFLKMLHCPQFCSFVYLLHNPLVNNLLKFCLPKYETVYPALILHDNPQK